MRIFMWLIVRGAFVCLLVPMLIGCGNAEKRLARVLLDTKLECKLDDECFQDDEYDCEEPFFTEGDILQAIDELGLGNDEINACRKAQKASDKCLLKSSCDEYLEERKHCAWGEEMVPCCEIEGWLSGEDLCAEESGGRCRSEISDWLSDCGTLVNRVNSIAHERVFGWRPDLPADLRVAPEASCEFEEDGLIICATFADNLSEDMTTEEGWCDEREGTFSAEDACEAGGDLGACVLPPLQGDSEGGHQVVQHYVEPSDSESSDESIHAAFSNCVDYGNFLPPPGVL